MRSSLVLALSPFLSSVSATFYTQSDIYQGANFFDKFNFFTDDDPSGGYVDYKSQVDAEALGLLSTTSTSAKWGVGSALLDPNDNTIRGRPSVRLEGKTSYTKGLFVADIAHMPGNACGIWPSFWTLGSGTWPLNGEVDIIEGVNQLTRNKASLHSGDSTCVINSAPMLGSIASTDCQTDHNGVADSFVGCGIDSGSSASFGTPFNNGNGGTYAMQWTDTFIKTWFFPRGSEPKSLSCSAPTPDVDFGTPDSFFSGCDIGSNFADNRLVFTTTFCGSWAGADGVYSTSCPLTFPSSDPEYKSCRAQVANHPETFEQGFWEVNSIKVFSETTTPPTCSSSSSSSSVASSTSSHASSSSTSFHSSSSSSTSSHASSSSSTSSHASSSSSTSSHASSTSSTSSHASLSSSSSSSTWSSTFSSSVTSVSIPSSLVPSSSSSSPSSSSSSSLPSISIPGSPVPSSSISSPSSSFSLPSISISGSPVLPSSISSSSFVFSSGHFTNSSTASKATSSSSYHTSSETVSTTSSYDYDYPSSSTSSITTSTTSSSGYGYDFDPSTTLWTSSYTSYPPIITSSCPPGFQPVKAVVKSVVTTEYVYGSMTSKVTTSATRCAMCHYKPTTPAKAIGKTASTNISGMVTTKVTKTHIITKVRSSTPAAPISAKSSSSVSYCGEITLTITVKGTPPAISGPSPYPKVNGTSSYPVKPVVTGKTNATTPAYSYPLQVTKNAAGKNVASVLSLIASAAVIVMMF